MNTVDVRDRLMLFIKTYILYDESIDELDFDESLIDNGYIDSIGIITLVSFIEENFKCRVYDHEILPENFDSINKIIKYLNNKLSQ